MKGGREAGDVRNSHRFTFLPLAFVRSSDGACLELSHVIITRAFSDAAVDSDLYQANKLRSIDNGSL